MDEGVEWNKMWWSARSWMFLDERKSTMSAYCVYLWKLSIALAIFISVGSARAGAPSVFRPDFDFAVWQKPRKVVFCGHPHRQQSNERTPAAPKEVSGIVWIIIIHPSSSLLLAASSTADSTNSKVGCGFRVTGTSIHWQRGQSINCYTIIWNHLKCTLEKIGQGSRAFNKIFTYKQFCRYHARLWN